MAYRIAATLSEGPYRAAYDHLNEHHDLGWTAKVVLGGFISSDGYDESWLQNTCRARGAGGPQ